MVYAFPLPGRHWHSLESRLCAEGLMAKYGRIAAGGTSGVQGEFEQLKSASSTWGKNSYFLKQYLIILYSHNTIDASPMVDGINSAAYIL